MSDQSRLRKAFIDTTVLTDALIKVGAARDRARAAIARYEETQLPQYAIKEFKAGPLTYYKWMHNKLATTNSFGASLDALQRMSRSPRKYWTATAIEALSSATKSLAAYSSSDMVKKYGEFANIDRIQCDEYRLAIKALIFDGWEERRRIATKVVCPIACYPETDPYEKRTLIEFGRTSCRVEPECSLALPLKSRPHVLMTLHTATLENNGREEAKRRAQVLRDLHRTPKRPLTAESCRNLGDAIFAFFAPDDAVILTTNTRDHGPLASAVGKSVDRP